MLKKIHDLFNLNIMVQINPIIFLVQQTPAPVPGMKLSDVYQRIEVKLTIIRGIPIIPRAW